MPLMEKGVRAVADRMPKVITPKVHTIIDYGVAAAFLAVAIKSLKSGSKKAGISAIIVAASELALIMMTDMPGGIARVVDLETHLKIDYGISGLVGSMPNAMGFSDEWQSWFFRSQGMSIAAVASLTSTRTAFDSRRARRAA
ncbi:MAG: hypothetical protein ACE14L_02200 [Terriglobales bacterium]